jgi:hypothetical protein
MPVMTPVAALQQLYGMDKEAARFLAGGIGVFAAAAVVLSFGIDLQTMLLVGLYVVGLALLMVVVVHLPLILRLVLGTFLTLLIIAVVTLFFISAVTTPAWPKPSYCLAKFWLPCAEATAGVVERNASTLNARVDVPPRIPAASDSTKAGPDAAVQPTRVYIQFAGLITRESVARLNASLRRGGWQAQGGSGERVASAAGLNEVRYSPQDSAETAKALADAVTATGIGSAPVSIRAMAIVPKGTMELWISN